ncbi:MAG TPA: hypothetical protein RMG48_08115 [Myxococcales bacterium LLY-WYZ-16_1]|jgi:cytochrome c553|nr:hypothetical protein [Myxococcales bacterium LLY-WYZ-16_1]
MASMTKLTPWMAVLAALACTETRSGPDESGPEKASAPSTQPAETAKSEPAVEEGSLHSHMQEHFVRVDQVQKAVVDGDLEEARRHAKWLAEHEPHSGLPEGWPAHLQDMQEEARAVLSGDGVGPMASATARLAGTCGSCHAAVGARVRLGAPKRPKAAIELHAWAADRLWDGVVSRSDGLWDAGVDALAASGVRPESDRVASKADLKQALQAFEPLPGRAQKAERPKDRVEVLGAYLGTCVACHGALKRDS